MQYRILLSLLIIIFISDCDGFGKNDKDITTKSLLGSWRLYNLENIDSDNADEHTENLLTEADDNEIVKQGMILSFFKDDTYTEVQGSGYYRCGKWKYSSKEKMLYLTDSGATRSIPISTENVNKRQRIVFRSTLLHKNFKFVKDAEPLKAFKEDPFYLTNNAWRIKPKQAETHDEIVQRLGNYFKHLLYILKSSKERKTDIVSFEFSMGPVRIYNGGIGIIPYPAINKNWINTYYNEANAGEAHTAFQRYLATSSYRGASAGNWIEDDYKILLSIYGDTQKGKF